jgi:membrane carboxypeptidase/penicillin-binding protein PbpC
VTADREHEGAAGARAALSIVSPPSGATYLIDPTLRREFQTLSLRAVSSSNERIAWSVNGEPVGMVAPGRKIDWPLVPGRHTIAARDAAGRTAIAVVVVR